MKLNRVGFVGWRGMVGSVLLRRMLAQDDFSLIDEPLFFTTSQAGRPGPDIGREVAALADARDLDALAGMDAVVSCQGGDYTGDVHPRLRARGWDGYWIDAASTLRMRPEATIILDPVNLALIERNLAAGGRDFIGGNCTVSLMMMALDGLFNADKIEWLTAMTYQAASGGGARQMRELVEQMGRVRGAAGELLDDPAASILDIAENVHDALGSKALPTREIGAPLAGSLLPWVDADPGSGVSREEWKAAAEANKILGREHRPIPVESVCVRVGVLRCHSQAFTIRLKEDLPMDEIEAILAAGNEWVSLVPNERRQSLARLTPAAVSGGMEIAVGRLRKLALDGAGNGAGNGATLCAFTVGDQLLWGAAEPLRRMLRILARQ